MKVHTLLACAGALAVLMAGGLAHGQEEMADHAPQQQGDVYKGCFNNCCCNGSAWIADVEMTAFRYNRGDGFRNKTVFDYDDISPRITIGYRNCDCLGFRVRYWNHDHDGAHNTSVDTYNIDLEVFEEIDLTCCTSVEWSAGVRYNEFDEIGIDGQQYFHGAGLIAGLQVNRTLGCYGGLYARGRLAVLTHHAADDQLVMCDVIRSQTELALGYEVRRCLSSGGILSLNIGWEMQYWEDYVDVQVAAGDVVPTSVGFNGVVAGIGLEY